MRTKTWTTPEIIAWLKKRRERDLFAHVSQEELHDQLVRREQRRWSNFHDELIEELENVK